MRYKLYYAYEGNSRCLTKSEDKIKQFINKTQTSNCYELNVSKQYNVGDKVNLVVIRNGRKIVGLEVFPYNDNSIHEIIGERVNSLYEKGSYKIFDLKIK